MRSLLPGLLLALTVSVAAGAASDPFADCEAAYEADPGGFRCCNCFYQVARRENRWREAAQRLGQRLAAEPSNHWARFYLGRIALDQGEDQAEGLLRAAAEGFAAGGDALGEAHSRINLCRFLSSRERLEEALAEIEAAAPVAGTSGDAGLGLEVELRRIDLLLRLGADLTTLDRLLRELEPRAFAADSYYPKRDLLLLRGQVAFELGRFSRARRCYQRLIELSRDAGDPHAEATGRLNLVLNLLASAPEGARSQAVALLEEALVAAETAGNRRVEQRARLALGRLLPGAAGREHLKRAVDLAREIDAPTLARSLGLLAVHLLEEDPAQARRLLAEAQAAALASPDPKAPAATWHERMKVVWATRPRHEAVADSMAVLGYVESLRDLQRAEGGRAELFSVWTEVYYWLAGRLLQAAEEEGSREALETAFQVAERMRARVLLEALAGPAPTRAASPSAPEERIRLLEREVEVHRRLLEPGLTSREQTDLLAELDELAAEESALADRLATSRADLPASAARAPELPAFASLNQVEASLGEDEALLSYQVALWETVYGEVVGGSWLLVSTREGTRVFRLPGRERVEPRVEVFLGLFQRRDGSEAAPSTALYRQLLVPALEELPPQVKRLIIVPDGALHLLPFAALREAAEAPALGRRFRLDVVPSATLWRSWRRARRPPAPAPALAFIDPAHALADPAAAGERGWGPAAVAGLGRLPFARREGRSLARRLGGGSRVVAGDEATEGFLKQADLARYGVVHFAAHALVDEESPGRSAVLLAPGGGGEDGLLTPEEIAALDLGSRVVVLSACHSATGNVLRGEGVMSLARAFFQAGAGAVVGSLWPLRDDDAAAFFDPFYRHLAAGESVDGALAAAQAERLEAGAPAAAWAGLVALGDGSLVPFPQGVAAGGGGRGRPAVTLLAALLATALLAALAGAGMLMRQRRQPGA